MKFYCVVDNEPTAKLLKDYTEFINSKAQKSLQKPNFLQASTDIQFLPDAFCHTN
jgi:hypothetical protein